MLLGLQILWVQLPLIIPLSCFHEDQYLLADISLWAPSLLYLGTSFTWIKLSLYFLAFAVLLQCIRRHKAPVCLSM